MFDDRVLIEPITGLLLDLSQSPAVADSPAMKAALEAMADLEAGAIANPDEGRQVGHYWLRSPALAPPEAGAAVVDSWAQLEALDRGDHDTVLLIGIGGSALGPQMVAAALAQAGDPARLLCLDNTDPEGLRAILGSIEPTRTLCLVASKSGSTPETRNGMLAAVARYAEAGCRFEDHAVAITVPGSALHRLSQGQGGPPWRGALPLWDWVGGRTSVTGMVGLAPMALCGWDWRGLLAGAGAMDAATRGPWESNPAAALAATWLVSGEGRGDKALVIEPYSDRLSLFGRYLQQLIMESLGKERDRQGQTVLQGLTVYGNKGSTDQHAFLQQVRDGRADTLVHFIDVVDHGADLPVGGGLGAGDYLLGFLLGTEAALQSNGRPSLRIQVPAVHARTLGALVALFERAVGLYAELINVNAYDQPGVEAGKKAATLALQALLALERRLPAEPATAADLAAGLPDALAWRLLVHLAATGRAIRLAGPRPALDRFAAPPG